MNAQEYQTFMQRVRERDAELLRRFLEHEREKHTLVYDSDTFEKDK